MLTDGESVEIDAMVRRGWTPGRIAKHIGRDPKTVRSYLARKTTPGERKTSECPLLEYAAYLAKRFLEDKHVRATVLYDEVCVLGYGLSYPSFTRHLRQLGLRPHCDACSGVKGRATVEIEHPPGEEIQWDWVELPQCPWGGTGHLLVGVLPHSGKARGVFCDSEDQAHLIWGIDQVLRRFSGTARRWRVDRMATVIVPGSDKVQPSFAPVAKHYGVGVDPCRARAANRKGAVEKAIDYITQSWWRTAPVATMAQAQDGLDRFMAVKGDQRARKTIDGLNATVADLADDETLEPLPDAAYPATLTVERKVGGSALVAFEGNRYSVPPTLIGTIVEVASRLGTDQLHVVSNSGRTVASHSMRPAGLGAIVRHREHAVALETAVLSAITDDRPCDRKPHRPPGPEATAEAERILAEKGRTVDPTTIDGGTVVDLADYGNLFDTPMTGSDNIDHDRSDDASESS